MKIDYKQLKDIIVDVAKKELLPRFANVSHTQKADKSIVTEADIATQDKLKKRLHERWPNIPLLGEEMEAEQQKKLLSTEQAIWCLDPLDGTTNFATGVPYFAISLALISKGKTQLGAVYDPIRDEYFFSSLDDNSQLCALLNEKRLKLPKNKTKLCHSVAIVDLKRLSKKLATNIAVDPPFASQRNFGASALDWCWLAASRSHVYLHGNQNIWDYAAGELIFRAAGGLSTTLEGEQVFKSSLEKRSVVAAIDSPIFDEWKKWLNVKIE